MTEKEKIRKFKFIKKGGKGVLFFVTGLDKPLPQELIDACMKKKRIKIIYEW